jgi:hypothetical protein
MRRRCGWLLGGGLTRITTRSGQFGKPLFSLNWERCVKRPSCANLLSSKFARRPKDQTTSTPYHERVGRFSWFKVWLDNDGSPDKVQGQTIGADGSIWLVSVVIHGWNWNTLPATLRVILHT